MFHASYIVMHKLTRGQHGGAVVSTVAYQQELCLKLSVGLGPVCLELHISSGTPASS